MNPFEPYLPAYREGTIPERPWWRREGSWCVRTDGACRRGNVGPPPTAYAAMCEGPWFPTREEWLAAIDAYDLAHPLPVPRVLAGQVWARAVAGGGWESFTVGYACDDDVIIIGRPFTQPRFERWSDLQNASLRDSVLVYGPLAPWAPPGWKP